MFQVNDPDTSFRFCFPFCVFPNLSRLVVHGEVDPLVVEENGRYLAQHIKGARLILYPNTGHIVIVERSEDFNRDVLAFLEK